VRGEILSKASFKLPSTRREPTLQLHGRAGPLKVQDVVAILPMLDTTAVLACSGRDLVAALENGVSQYPKLEGRFPQVGACLERLGAGWAGGWLRGWLACGWGWMAGCGGAVGAWLRAEIDAG
jgi:hypothetical protein